MFLLPGLCNNDFTLSPQGSICSHHGAPEPWLHSALLRLPLPGAAGDPRLPARWLDALPVRHLPGHPGPRPLWLIGLSAPGSADLPLLAAAQEHPLLEVKGNWGKTGPRPAVMGTPPILKYEMGSRPAFME